jgi:hypothetical protein
MEVQKQNIADPLGSPRSGIYAPEVHIALSEQLLVSGWIRAADLVSISVLGSTGTRALVGYGAEISTPRTRAAASR